MFNFKTLSISDVLLLEPKVFNDERGFFYEANNPKYEKTILWSDLDLKINWPITQPIISEKDIHTAIKFRDIIKE